MEATMVVEGVNGDSVTLAGPDAGREGIWLATEVSGLVDPQADVVHKPAGGRPGSRFVSHRITERSLVFKVTILNNEDDAWEARDARWRKLWSYDKPSAIKVTTPRWGTRTLYAQLSEIEVDTKFDPHVQEATDVTMTVTAYDPFWYAPVYKQTVRSDSGSFSFKVKNGLNPTPNVVFPEWVIDKPGTFKFPHGDPARKLPKVPVTLESGEEAVVNTDPGARQIVEVNGTPVWSRMNGVRFRYGFEPYTESEGPLVVDGPAGAEVQLRIQRPFNRPWGDA